MRRLMYVACVSISVALSLPASAQAPNPEFVIGRFIGPMRDMIGKPLLDASIDFNNKSPFILEALTPEGSRFFFGGNGKTPGQSATDLRQQKGFSIFISACPGAHDLTAKISTVSIWQTLDEDQKIKDHPYIGLGLEELLTLMNTSPGMATPTTLRAPKPKELHGPVFEFVRGDTTEVLAIVNEGSETRISWGITNTAICSK